MTVRAMAWFVPGAEDGVSGLNTGPVGYMVQVRWSAVDDADTTSTVHSGMFDPLNVPYSLHPPRKLDEFIRDAVAAAILNISGLTIDPYDIYFPMTN
jgi:hypothetical protein